MTGSPGNLLIELKTSSEVHMGHSETVVSIMDNDGRCFVYKHNDHSLNCDNPPVGITIGFTNNSDIMDTTTCEIALLSGQIQEGVSIDVQLQISFLGQGSHNLIQCMLSHCSYLHCVLPLGGMNNFDSNVQQLAATFTADKTSHRLPIDIDQWLKPGQSIPTNAYFLATLSVTGNTSLVQLNPSTRIIILNNTDSQNDEPSKGETKPHPPSVVAQHLMVTTMFMPCPRPTSSPVQVDNGQMISRSSAIMLGTVFGVVAVVVIVFTIPAVVCIAYWQKTKRGSYDVQP